MNGEIKYQAKDVPISEVLVYSSGNSGLTEEEIYQNILSDERKYEVLSAATTEEKRLGFIPKGKLNGKDLKVVEGQEGILVVRKGKAGTVIFREKGKYALTDDAYFLTPNPKCKYSVT